MQVSSILNSENTAVYTVIQFFKMVSRNRHGAIIKFSFMWTFYMKWFLHLWLLLVPLTLFKGFCKNIVIEPLFYWVVRCYRGLINQLNFQDTFTAFTETISAVPESEAGRKGCGKKTPQSHTRYQLNWSYNFLQLDPLGKRKEQRKKLSQRPLPSLVYNILFLHATHIIGKSSGWPPMGIARSRFSVKKPLGSYNNIYKVDNLFLYFTGRIVNVLMA